MFRRYYVQHYPSDPFRLKGLVALIWCLECLHAAFSCHAAYYWLVLNYLNPEALNVSVWSADSALIIAGILVFVTHCFFCYRVWAVSGRTYIMPGIIFFLALASFGLDWAVFVLSVREKTFSGFGHAIQVTSSAGLAFKVATDTTIAGSLGFFLHRSKSGIQSTDHLVNKLTFYAINIGCLTSIIDILVLAWVCLLDLTRSPLPPDSLTMTLPTTVRGHVEPHFPGLVHRRWKSVLELLAGDPQHPPVRSLAGPSRGRYQPPTRFHEVFRWRAHHHARERYGLPVRESRHDSGFARWPCVPEGKLHEDEGDLHRYRDCYRVKLLVGYGGNGRERSGRGLGSLVS
ncbi:hypothetical protein L227DRAFT_658537, partial [Lentinus tigrinus ALCF2SS1-6]